MLLVQQLADAFKFHYPRDLVGVPGIPPHDLLRMNRPVPTARTSQKRCTPIARPDVICINGM